jgi:hypothetical protein
VFCIWIEEAEAGAVDSGPDWYIRHASGESGSRQGCPGTSDAMTRSDDELAAPLR